LRSNVVSEIYIGSRKHKRWVPGGAAGSICPPWTHEVDGRNFGNVPPEDWNGWPRTRAQRLLEQSVLHEGVRYAAAEGLAFCAQPTGNRAWHGYPVPWRDVPAVVRAWLVKAGQVEEIQLRRALRKQAGFDVGRDRQWALGGNDE
jgi:hypothetical protein